MKPSQNLHPVLKLIDELVFNPCGINCSNLQAEPESQEYAACNFQLDGEPIIFRLAKTTPKKTGQFVTIWNRNEKGITQPFSVTDNFEFLIIAVTKEDQFGLFIFPKIVLSSNKILSGNSQNGKRGIRIYPAWDLTTNKQAYKTQVWQTTYFLDISQNKSVDLKKAAFLLTLSCR